MAARRAVAGPRHCAGDAQVQAEARTLRAKHERALRGCSRCFRELGREDAGGKAALTLPQHGLAGDSARSRIPKAQMP